MSRYPKLVITTKPGLAEPELGRFLRLEADTERVYEESSTVWSMTLLDKLDAGPCRILFLSTALHTAELMQQLRDFRWPYKYIFMTAESARYLVPMFLMPVVPIDAGDYKPPESVSEFKPTLILD